MAFTTAEPTEPKAARPTCPNVRTSPERAAVLQSTSSSTHPFEMTEMSASPAGARNQPPALKAYGRPKIPEPMYAFTIVTTLIATVLECAAPVPWSSELSASPSSAGFIGARSSWCTPPLAPLVAGLPRPGALARLREPIDHHPPRLLGAADGACSGVAGSQLAPPMAVSSTPTKPSGSLLRLFALTMEAWCCSLAGGAPLCATPPFSATPGASASIDAGVRG